MVTYSPPAKAFPSSHNSNTIETTQPSSHEGAHEDLPEDSNQLMQYFNLSHQTHLKIAQNYKRLARD